MRSRSYPRSLGYLRSFSPYGSIHLPFVLGFNRPFAIAHEQSQPQRFTHSYALIRVSLCSPIRNSRVTPQTPLSKIKRCRDESGTNENSNKEPMRAFAAWVGQVDQPAFRISEIDRSPISKRFVPENTMRNSGWLHTEFQSHRDTERRSCLIIATLFDQD